MRTIFVRPGARRPYVPYGALKNARAEVERLRDAATAEEQGRCDAETERDRYRDALARIDRLQARWDAPLRHEHGDMGEAAWAAVGSEATKIARDALGTA